MTQINEIYALCYAEQFREQALQEYLLQNERCTLYRNVLNLEWKQGNAFIFDYGVIVFWNISVAERASLLQKLNPFTENPLEHLIDDEFTYSVNAEQLAIKNDHISLVEDDVLAHIAISHGLAQSIKLAQFEYQVQQTINETAYIPKNIADDGNSKLPSKELAKIRGRLFIAKSNIMLKYDLLDVPDFFWDYPELDHLYAKIATYLEVQQRITVLSKKLETIHELLGMMAEEQKHKHASLLEWIVIWLIAFEVLATIFHDLLGII